MEGLAPQIDARLAGIEKRGDKIVVHSLSGNERDHYFANRGGRSFDDWSALSGLDNPSDGRGFAVLDYDRDGWQDLALVNADQPLLNLYHNEMRAAGMTGGVVAIRFVGGNRSSGGSSEYACRDGYGARILADLGDSKLTREHRCGDGFAAQHSATMILGIGARTTVPSLTVRWPSGKTAATADVPEGTLLTVYENPADAPDGDPFVRATYRVAPSDAAPSPAMERPAFPLAEADAHAIRESRMRVYTTLATWCPACKKHVPKLQRLSEELGAEGVELVAVPIDEDDDAEKLAGYVKETQLPSRMLALDAAKRAEATAAFAQALGEPAPLPSTVVTDASGRILFAQPGVPSVSALRKLLPPSRKTENVSAATGSAGR